MSINVNVGNNIPAEVIEVGQEISVNQLAAITSATSPSASNPFSTAGHTHVAANITDLSGLLDAKANLSHTHAIANVTGLQLSLDGKALSGHIHNILDVTGLQTALDGKSATTHLHTGVYAPLAHTHTIADTTGLQTALDGKSATTHLHTGVYAPVAHTHAIADTTGLQTALDGKSDTTHLHAGVYAPVVHTHTISDTTGLQTALDGKSATTHLHTGVYAPVTHAHAIADVTGLQTALDSKVSGAGYALLTGASFSGEIEVPQIGNLLNTDLIIDAYNDTGAGTHYYHKFNPTGGLVLAPNGGYLQVGPSGSVYSLSSNGLTTGWLDFDIGRIFNISKNGLVWDNDKTFNYILGNGFSFNDKVSAVSVGGKAGLNVGIGGASATATTAGDLWIENAGIQINYRDGSGILRTCLVTNASNAIDVNSTSPTLRLTQRGTGDAFRVEDSTSPDTTSFIVSNSGKVGIGLNIGANITSDLEIVKSSGATQALNITGTSGLAVLITGSSYTPALQVNFGYIQSEGGFKINTTGGVLSRLLAPVTGTGTYDKEIQVTINGADYRIPCRLG